MAFKNQLQFHVFVGTVEMASQLTPLIIQLQTAALKLHNMEVNYFLRNSYLIISLCCKYYI